METTTQGLRSLAILGDVEVNPDEDLSLCEHVQARSGLLVKAEAGFLWRNLTLRVQGPKS